MHIYLFIFILKIKQNSGLPFLEFGAIPATFREFFQKRGARH
jgi:presenilin-like A22 family membrane protease